MNNQSSTLQNTFNTTYTSISQSTAVSITQASTAINQSTSIFITVPISTILPSTSTTSPLTTPTSTTSTTLSTTTATTSSAASTTTALNKCVGVTCAANAYCVSTPTTYSCYCTTGYYGVPDPGASGCTRDTSSKQVVAPGRITFAVPFQSSLSNLNSDMRKLLVDFVVKALKYAMSLKINPAAIIDIQIADIRYG